MSEVQHTFGGRSMDRYLYEFEVPDPSGAGDPGPGGDPGGDPAGDPAEPAWSLSQEDYENLAGAVGYLAQLEQQRAQVYAPQTSGTETPRPDPWERPESFQDDLDAYINQRMAPVQQFQTEAQFAEAEERAMDILSDNATRGGDFDKDVARLRADALLPKMQAQYGFGPKAAEAALEAAANEQRAYETQVRERAVAEYTNQLSTLSGAPHEPGSQYTVGVKQRTMPDYTQGGTVASRFFGPKAEA